MAETGALSTKQRRAVEALLTEPTIRAAAKAAGIGERTITRYLADDGFKSELRRRQDAVVTSLTAAIVGLAGESVEALRDILRDAKTSPSVKARVGLGWLAQMGKVVELADLADRVSKLEGQLK